MPSLVSILMIDWTFKRTSISCQKPKGLPDSSSVCDPGRLFLAYSSKPVLEGIFLLNDAFNWQKKLALKWIQTPLLSCF